MTPHENVRTGILGPMMILGSIVGPRIVARHSESMFIALVESLDH